MYIVGITFVLLGILSLVFALYLAHIIVSYIIKTCKKKERLDIGYTLILMLSLICLTNISYQTFNSAYYYCIELPKQRAVEKMEEKIEEKEREAYRKYVLENGVYEAEESELVVVDKYTKHKGSHSGKTHRCRTSYIVVLENDSGTKYEIDIKNLFLDVKIGDIVIREQTIVTDKNNGKLLDLYDPYYYKKES